MSNMTRALARAEMVSRLGDRAPGYTFQRSSGRYDWCSLDSEIGRGIRTAIATGQPEVFQFGYRGELVDTFVDWVRVGRSGTKVLS